MLIIQIHDEQLARRLEQIVERENRSIEDVLRTLVDRYPAPPLVEASPRKQSETAKRIRHKAYAKARQYWKSVDDTAKVLMTDEELDELFGAFDEEGIPRLKSELKSLEPPIGSLAYAAQIVREKGGIHTTGSLDVVKADDLLNQTFADDLLKRMRGEDASE
jgi:hypothetical protein